MIRFLQVIGIFIAILIFTRSCLSYRYQLRQDRLQEGRQETFLDGILPIESIEDFLISGGESEKGKAARNLIEFLDPGMKQLRKNIEQAEAESFKQHVESLKSSHQQIIDQTQERQDQ